MQSYEDYSKKQTKRKSIYDVPRSAFYLETLPRLFFLFPDIQSKLEKIIQTKINDPKIFEISLIHRSYLTVLQKEFEELKVNDLFTNERLEFLGDSIFNFIITEYIFQTYPHSNEGNLTDLRAKLINRQVMSDVAYKLHLEEYIRASFNVKQHIENHTTAVLSNALEALVGAIYVDSGYQTTKNFVLNIILPLLSEIHAYEIVNYKSRLMEIVQAQNKPTPTYSILAEEGPPNNRIFYVGAYIEGMLWGTALGTTKKEAEQLAAKNALEIIENITINDAFD
jgi:ribonuclease-3